MDRSARKTGQIVHNPANRTGGKRSAPPLPAPDMHHTRLRGSKLWHLALLELWLQRNLDAVFVAP